MYEEKGLLMLYKSEKVGEETIHEGKEAENMGLQVDFLSKSELRNVETGVETTAIGGVHYKSDSHLSPNKLIAFLKSELEKLNVKLLPNTEVTDFKIANNAISEVLTKKGNYKADEMVIATGSWSPQLATKLGINVSILPGKGYSFTLKDRSEKPAIPSILCEGKVAVTPMGKDLRFGGTMEITHTNDTKINMNRMEGIINTIHSFYPTLEVNTPKKEDIWYGFRPCTSSGLPIISRSRKHANVIIATGHGMMGLSLAPATGKLVEELVSDKKASVSIDILTY
jgi:D-amino-acid dehydrogenase